MNIKRFSLAATVFAALMLSACETTTTSSGGGSWTNIGTISEGNIKVAIDKSSIKRNGALVTFRDKKTVSKLKEERFVNTPAYKTAIGSWEIHCSNKTYRLAALQLIDEHGRVISNQSYTPTSIRPMSVMSGTITEKQYETVCGHKL
ncbi:TPA: surface-adhesin E family protein [Neisseria subflava]